MGRCYVCPFLLFECSRISIPIVDVLLNILLLAGEEVSAHTDAYHAVVVPDGVPFLATQYRVATLRFGA